MRPTVGIEADSSCPSVFDFLWLSEDFRHVGPAFLLAERLTGIPMTPQLLEESTYLCGVVPRSR